jgi:hypothetical protein
MLISGVVLTILLLGAYSLFLLAGLTLALLDRQREPLRVTQHKEHHQ